MKIKTRLTLAALLGALSLTAHAQDAGGPPQGGPGDSGGQDGPGGPGGPDGQGGQGGPGMGRHRPIPAIVAALDINHDGIIDSNEIANASVVLKTLDKNGDGKLTPDEYMGKPPGRRHMNGNGGPDGGQGQGEPGQGGPSNDGPQGPPPGNN
jgi:hypothetical protein